MWKCRMRRLTCALLGTCVVATLIACGSPALEFEEPCPEQQPVDQLPAALTVASIDMSPGCFAALAAAGACPDSVCEQARTANAAREVEIRELSTPFAALFDRIATEPRASQWSSIEAFDDNGSPTRVRTLEAVVRDAQSGYLMLSLVDDTDPEVHYTETSPALYSAEGVVIQLRMGVVRWSSHALNTGSFYRGCDPVSGVSFDQRFADDGVFDLYCWDTGGNPVECSSVDLWPVEA